MDLELLESLDEDARATTTAAALVPSADAEFAVVSDVDDTVIKSSAADTLEQARLTLLEDAASRTPFQGVDALYRALVAGPDDEGINPIFYLSRSGWNLYDLFTEFFEAHDIPRGPMFFRDLAVREDKSSALGSEHHKLARIRDLLMLYPDLPFVLIGDSGQGDIENYRRIAIENPGRVRAVYLRDVSEDSERDREIEAVAEDLRRRGVSTLLGEHSLRFAEHMAEEGLISETALEEVRASVDDPHESEQEV